jgi:hypothetical protein
MAEHSHEIVTHLYHVKLPYGQDGKDLEFEPNGGKTFGLSSLLDTMAKGYSEDEMRRIFVGAVALLEKYPHRSLAEALDTAMVWERG